MANRKTRKNKRLAKMAIKDVRPGQPVGGSVWKHDYSHVLPEATRKDYQIHISEDGKLRSLRADVKDKQGASLGYVQGYKEKDENGDKYFHINVADLNPNHRGKGLGTAMYEALFAHALHFHGINDIRSDSHSSMAHKAKKRLHEKHGFKEWSPRKVGREKGPYDNAYAPTRFLTRSELQKGAGHALAAAMAMALAPDPSPKSDPHALQNAIHAEAPPKWTPKGLHEGLLPIAFLESSFGKNINHAPNAKGPYHTAQGAVGMKPVTAHEEYKRSPTLQTTFPGLDTPEAFTQKFMGDHSFYNLCATAHWMRLLSNQKTPQKAAYAWRWGNGAANKADDAKIHTDPYVVNYNKLAPAPVAKSYDPVVVVEPKTFAKSLPYEPKDLEEGKTYFSEIYDEDPSSVNFSGVEEMAPADFIDDASHLGERQGYKVGWLKDLPQEQWPEELRSAYDRDFGHIIAAHVAQKMNPGIRIDGRFADGRGRAQFHHALGLPMRVASFSKLGKSLRKVEADPDHIAHLDSIERSLHIKRKGVTPQELFEAMFDPVPSVRRTAVLHPELTPDLLQQALIHPDEWTRHQVTFRNDLKPEHMAVLANDPVLAKADPHPSNLVVADEIQQTPVDPNGQPWEMTIHGDEVPDPGAHTALNQVLKDRSFQSQFDGYNGVSNDNGLVDHTLPNGRVNWNFACPHCDTFMHHDDPEAIELHFQQKHPQLVNGVHSNWYLRHNFDSAPGDEQRPIERAQREGVQPSNPDTSKEGMIARARQAGLIKSEIRKSLEDMHDLLELRLGMSHQLKTLCQAAKFVTGKAVDPDVLRAKLKVHNENPTKAVLDASGMGLSRAEELLSVANMFRVQKTEGITKPRNILPAYPDCKEMADEVRQAYAQDKVKPVNLKGAHTKGMALAELDDHRYVLLKPGTHQPSPAMGVDDTNSSQSRREAAFYAVAAMLGLQDDLPETHLLYVDGQEVAVTNMLPSDWEPMDQLLQKDPGFARKTLDRYRTDGRLFRWSVLDYMLGNPDSHGNNMLTKDGQVKLIDHGSAFAGDNFNPANDQSSFVPFYLRAWAPEEKWPELRGDQKLAFMPVANSTVDAGLRQFVHTIDRGELQELLQDWHIDPTAVLKRLDHLRAIQGNLSLGINKLWVE